MRSLLVLITLIAFSPIAFAEEKADTQKEEKVPKTPITKWLAAESAVVEALEDSDKETYFILRNKYGVIRAIRVVKRDVGNAIQACGQENPEIQDNLNARFKDWKGAVDPILKTAEAFLKQEIKEQKVVKVSTFNKMLDLNDDAFDYQESLVDKRPVTTVEACQKLLKSMDATESDMLRLMQDILLPESYIRDQAERLEKAKEKNN